MQYSLKAEKKFMPEEKENNSKWDFYHSRNTKPEGLLKAQHIFQHGAGIYVSTSQCQCCIRTLTVLRTHSSHNPTATDYYHGILLQFPNSLIKTHNVTVVPGAPDTQIQKKKACSYILTCESLKLGFMWSLNYVCVFDKTPLTERGNLQKLYRNKMKFK